MPRFTKTIELMTFDELDEQAKEKARAWFRNRPMDFESEDLTQMFKEDLQELGYPTNDVRWSLSFSQGDGVAFYGIVHEVEKILTRLGLADLVDFNAGVDINIEKVGPGNYDHYNSMEVEVRLYDALGDREAREETIAEAVEEDVERVSQQLQKMGEDYLTDVDSDEYVDDAILANEYTFDAQGNRMN